MSEIMLEIDQDAINETVQESMNKDEPIPVNFETLANDLIKKLYRDTIINDFSKSSEITDITKNRVIIVGDIGEDTGDILDGFIRFWNTHDRENNIPVEERTPIKVLVNSNGGDLISAYTAINAIENSITPVYTINVGKAYSAGFLILLAGHKRFGYKMASYMFHEGSCMSGGDANKFRNWAAFYQKQLEQMGEYLLEKTSITKEDYESHVKDDWWFTSTEAKEKGIISEICEKGWIEKC